LGHNNNQNFFNRTPRLLNAPSKLIANTFTAHTCIMESPKEYNCDAFIEQQKLQAQLQPWKGDLVKLAAEFNSLKLETIHGEITCFGNLAKKNHDEGIAGVRKVSSTISRSHL
jgi:hypothetical protein